MNGGWLDDESIKKMEELKKMKETKSQAERDREAFEEFTGFNDFDYDGNADMEIWEGFLTGIKHARQESRAEIEELRSLLIEVAQGTHTSERLYKWYCENQASKGIYLNE